MRAEHPAQDLEGARAAQMGQRFDGSDAHLSKWILEQLRNFLRGRIVTQTAERLASVVTHPCVCVTEPRTELLTHRRIARGVTQRTHGERARAWRNVTSGLQELAQR